MEKDILDYQCKKEFAEYVSTIIHAWADGHEIEYKTWTSNGWWDNIKNIPEGEEVWNFAYYQFKVQWKVEEEKQ
jgi:hypothetical protein